MSLMSPALADGFFTTSITWEAHTSQRERESEKEREMMKTGNFKICRSKNPGGSPSSRGIVSYLQEGQILFYLGFQWIV